MVIAHLSWPWVFWVNVPVGLIVLVAGRRVLPRGEPGQAGRVDVIGLVLVGIGLPALVYAVTAWGQVGTPASPRVLVSVVVAVAALAAFVQHSLRHPAPLTELRLLRNRTFAAAGACAAVTGAAMFGIVLLLPLLFQLGAANP